MKPNVTIIAKYQLDIKPVKRMTASETNIAIQIGVIVLA